MSDPYKRDRRLGRWYLSAKEQMEYPGIVEAIQPHVTILRAWPAMIHDRLEFMGRSPDFEIVEEGCEVPLYRPVIEGDKCRWELMQ